jgi:hypothetical protein
MFEYAYEIGLNTPTLAWAYGMKTTFPFGVKTPDLHLSALGGIPGTATFENSLLNGLKNPTFE